MKTSTILISVICILLVLAIVIFIANHLYWGEPAAVFAGIGVIGICVLLFCYTISVRHQEKIDAMKADTSVEWYLDGELVDIDKVEPTLYRTVISDDGKKVFLTHGNN